MSRIFVGIVQTIVIAITNINPGYAISIVASEKIAETSATFRFTVLWRFVRSVTAVVVAVAIPRGRYAPMIRASEAVGRTRSLSTMYWVLVTVVTTIVIAITQPIRFHAYVCFFTLQMIRRTRNVLWAPIVCFVRSCVVFTIVHTVTHLKIIKFVNKLQHLAK